MQPIPRENIAKFHPHQPLFFRYRPPVPGFLWKPLTGLVRDGARTPISSLAGVRLSPSLKWEKNNTIHIFSSSPQILPHLLDSLSPTPLDPQMKHLSPSYSNKSWHDTWSSPNNSITYNTIWGTNVWKLLEAELPSCSPGRTGSRYLWIELLGSVPLPSPHQPLFFALDWG
jgi:hypothetical protein